MNGIDRDYIQSAINYCFKNTRLLDQAFTRKSYSAEHPDVQNNELLEFYGDRILDLFVTKMMYNQFSKIVNNEFFSEKSEGELTKLKAIIVSKDSLAQCMRNFDFAKFLYLGKSDEQNDVQESASVNEDLFEAIIGAVAVDCNWNYPILDNVCERMLQLESVNNRLTVLVKEKSCSLGLGYPPYKPRYWQVNTIEDSLPHNYFNSSFFGIPDFCTSKNPKTGLHEYGVVIDGKEIIGTGDGTFQAKVNAEQKAYHFLCQEEIKRSFKNLDYSNPVSTLHELIQKKIIHDVYYEFSEYHDENGNPIWNCKATLEGYGKFSADNVSKKQVKQDAALKLLRYITDTVIEVSDGSYIPKEYHGNAFFWSDEEKAKYEAEFEKIFPNKETK